MKYSFKEQILTLHDAFPRKTAAEIADLVACHPAYVRTVGQRCGLQFASPENTASPPHSGPNPAVGKGKED